MDIKEYILSGVIEQYVLGLATVEEVAELEQLRIQYPEVNEAVVSFENDFETYLLANPVKPPAFIKTFIEKELFGEAVKASDDKVIELISKKETPVRNIAVWKFLAAACIILLIASTGLNLYFYSGYKDSKQQYEALLTERNTLQANNASYKQSLQMFDDTAMVHIDMKGTPGKEQNLATVLWDKNSKDVYINAINMQQTPDGKQYQLWAIVDGKPVDAGIINNCIGLCKMKKIEHAEAFAVTLEKEGGSSTPTLSEMYVMGKT
ncbi:MAG: anti-sigma factor [Parafilimonas sp.]